MVNKFRGLAALAGFFLFATGSLFAQTPRNLSFGSQISGSLRTGEEQWFSIRPAGAGMVVVETFGDTIDTYLEAYDASRNLLSENDDGGEGLNARIELFVNEGQTYLFKLRCLGDGGPYRLMALFETISPRNLNFGSWVSGSLRVRESHWFSVRPTQAGIVTVETTGDTDTYLEVYDSSNKLISEDDDGGEGSNARIELLVEAGQTYLYKLRCFGDASGPYRLIAGFETISPRSLSFGSWASGNLYTGESQWFSVRPAQAGIVTVETTGGVDTYLEAYDPSSKLIGEDDDSGEGYNARLNVFAEAGRTYLFKLKSVGDTSGAYRIIAGFEQISAADIGQNYDRSRSVSLNANSPVPIFLRTPRESRWYRFDISNPNSLLVVETRGDIDTYLLLYDDRGNLIEEDDDGGEGNNARISRSLGRGTVYIEVWAYRMGRTTLHTEVWRRD